MRHPAAAVAAAIERRPFTAFLAFVVIGFGLFAWRTEIVRDDAFAAIAAESAARQTAFEQRQAVDEANRCDDQAAAREAVRRTLIEIVLTHADPADPTKRIAFSVDEIAASPALSRIAAYVGPGGALEPIVCPPSTTSTTGAPPP